MSRTSAFRPSVRLRLTLLYGGLFLVAGAVLLTLNYALVRQGLESQAKRFSVPVGLSIEGDVPIEGSAPVWAAPPDQLIGPDGRPVDVVLREYEADVRNRTLDELLAQSAVALAVMAVVSVGLGWAVAGRALQPLQRMTATARRLSQDNLHERLAMNGPQDELKELADTFDAMLARLESAFESQRRFVANASHELRTPLAIQRTLVDVALADPDVSPDELRMMAVGVRDGVERSERLIDGLLALARSDRGQLDASDRVDLAAAAASTLELTRADVAETGLRVETTLHPATVTGSRVLVERLVGNLVQNAVRYNVAGGWVRVQTGVQGDHAVVRVANSGPVIPPDQVATLFEPFRRLATERVGSQHGVGLGLSIVRAVAIGHHGTVRARALDSGGLDVAVNLPLAPSSIRSSPVLTTCSAPSMPTAAPSSASRPC